MRAPARTSVAMILALVAGVGCASRPAEAPAPDASAWPEAVNPNPKVASSPATATTAREAEPPAPDAIDRPPRTIYRAEIKRAVGPGPAYLLRQLGPEPFRHQGHFVGWEITQLFPDDPSLCADPCDLALGDVILGVNGHPMRTPQELSAVLRELPGWTSLRVHSLRDGQRREVTYTIVDDKG